MLKGQSEVYRLALGMTNDDSVPQLNSVIGQYVRPWLLDAEQNSVRCRLGTKWRHAKKQQLKGRTTTVQGLNNSAVVVARELIVMRGTPTPWIFTAYVIR